MPKGTLTLNARFGHESDLIWQKSGHRLVRHLAPMELQPAAVTVEAEEGSELVAVERFDCDVETAFAILCRVGRVSSMNSG
jgi:hypothetical protein